MTSEEKQEIINAVLAALRTNSKSIDQLTPVSEMSEADFLELNGGRKVSYGVLFANHMSSDEAQEAWEYLDTNKVDKDLRGLVEVHQAPVVFLDAMGILDGHALNGSDGLEYRPDYKQIHDFPDGKIGAPKQGAVYISKNNFKKFVWNGTDMEELKPEECPLFVDYMEPVAFATLPVGGSYYVPSSHKIAVKIDASNTKTYDPLPDALYFFRDKGMIYTWKSSTNKWVPAGSDIKVVNNLTEGGEADALSAEQGKVLKGLIDNIGTGSIAAFAQYAVFESVSALPATGAATTGYIVGNHIYAYVGTGGDTRDGKYQDLGALEAAGVSVTTAEDGTFTIHAGGNDYTVNLNHTHPNMCKLVVCEESGLPSTLDPSTIYAQVNDAEDPTEIEVLYIAGIEFSGGGVPAGTPVITKPSGTTLNLGTNDGSGVSQTIEIRGRSLTGDLTVTVGTGLTVTYNGTTASSVTIPLANALAGAMVTVSYSGSGALEDGSLVISGGGATPKSVVVVVVEPYVTAGLVFHLDGADATTTEWRTRKGGVTFAMNNVTLDGNGGVVFNGTNSYGRYSAASSLGFAPATHTIEVVANIGGTATALLFMQNNSGDLALGMTGMGSIIAAVSSAANSEPKRRVTNQTRGLQTISFANLAAYKNKGTLSVEQDGNFDPTANAGVFIGARDTARSFFEGTIYQIRVYNRLLTAEEILANQQVDIERYNIQ